MGTCEDFICCKITVATKFVKPKVKVKSSFKKILGFFLSDKGFNFCDNTLLTKSNKEVIMIYN